MLPANGRLASDRFHKNIFPGDLWIDFLLQIIVLDLPQFFHKPTPCKALPVKRSSPVANLSTLLSRMMYVGHTFV